MKKTIILDMGHRKDTPGKRANGLLEWEFNEDVCYRIKEKLKDLYNVFFTIQAPIHPFSENTSAGRTSNLNYRVKIANDIYKDYPNAIFISIHANAHDDPKVSGYEIFVYKKGYTAEKIANNIMRAAKVVLGVESEIKNRGIKEAGFYVLKHTDMPAVLIEHEFYTNKDAVQKLKSDEFREKCVDHIVEGIKKYFGDSIPKSIIEEKNSKYFNIEGLHVIETTPDNIYISKLGNTLKRFGIYGINGTWQDNLNAKNIESIWGIAANRGKCIGPNSYTNSPNGYSRGTIIYYKDGTIDVKRINNISEIEKTFNWAIGGGMLLPFYNPSLEGFIGKFSDVLRKTEHTGMGYKDGKVYLFAKENCTMEEFLNSIKFLQLEGAIFLDGGSSTQLNYKKLGIDSNRILSHGVFLNQI